jgi:hypothetical protein
MDEEARILTDGKHYWVSGARPRLMFASMRELLDNVRAKVVRLPAGTTLNLKPSRFERISGWEDHRG